MRTVEGSASSPPRGGVAARRAGGDGEVLRPGKPSWSRPSPCFTSSSAYRPLGTTPRPPRRTRLARLHAPNVRNGDDQIFPSRSGRAGESHGSRQRNAMKDDSGMTMRDLDQAEAVLTARLDELGIAWTSERHAPVFTVEQARTLGMPLGGGGTKNLFLRDRRKRFVLLVADEDTLVDLKSLAARVGRGPAVFRPTRSSRGCPRRDTRSGIPVRTDEHRPGNAPGGRRCPVD